LNRRPRASTGPTIRRHPQGAQHHHSSKAEAELQAALNHITDINEGPASRSEKWGINDSFLFSLIGCCGQLSASSWPRDSRRFGADTLREKSQNIVSKLDRLKVDR